MDYSESALKCRMINTQSICKYEVHRNKKIKKSQRRKNALAALFDRSSEAAVGALLLLPALIQGWKLASDKNDDTNGGC